MSDRPIYEAVLHVLARHEYNGDGMCICGSAIGWSDGITVHVHLDEHLAAMIEQAVEVLP